MVAKRLTSKAVLVSAAIPLLAACAGSKQTKTPMETPLIGTYWQLVELYGQPISAAEAAERVAFLQLATENTRAFGNSGCNNFNGTYTQAEGLRLRFSNVATTMMACRDMEVEKRFLEALNLVDNYTIAGDALSLSKARMAPVARFKAVKK
jgi:heat shock protein HslJ